MVIDTGSQIGLNASNTIKKEKTVKKPIYHLTGINGDDHKIETKGYLMGNFITDDNTHWLTQIHLIDERHAGKYDGYVGYDFLKKYGAKIDLHNKVLKLHKPEMSKSHETRMKPAIKKDENGKINQKTSNKKVAFVIPDDKNGYLIEKIPVKKCQSGSKICVTCETNEKSLPNYWKSDELTDASVTAINPAIEQANTAEISSETVKINDHDTEMIKLQKIEKNKLNLPSHVTEYMRAFPQETLETENKTIRKVTISPELSREENIIANLPTDHCTSETKEKIEKLVNKYPMQFYLEGDMLGKTDIIQHKIYLKPGTPILHTRQFRLSETMRKDVIKETEEMEEQGVIQKSDSPFNSPAFMVKKKDEEGSYNDQRFVTNYIKVNENTELRDFPLPRIEQMVDNFSKCKYFSTIDIKSAYHQIESYEPHREITAFTAGFTKYEWYRMPEGLCGAPLTMQKAVIRLLGDLLEQGVNVYIDDVSIGTPDVEKHDYLLDQVFERLHKHNFQVKISKCHFYVK